MLAPLIIIKVGASLMTDRNDRIFVLLALKISAINMPTTEFYISTYRHLLEMLKKVTGKRRHFTR